MIKVGRFFKLSNSEKLLFLKAIVLLPVYQCYVKLLPFRYLKKLLKLESCSSASEHQSIATLSEVSPVVRAIKRVDCYFPLISGRCLAQALVVRRLLHQKKINSVLHLGVKHDQGSETMSAHAWLCIEGGIVIGEHDKEQYTEVASFV